MKLKLIGIIPAYLFVSTAMQAGILNENSGPAGNALYNNVMSCTNSAHNYMEQHPQATTGAGLTGAGIFAASYLKRCHTEAKNNHLDPKRHTAEAAGYIATGAASGAAASYTYSTNPIYGVICGTLSGWGLYSIKQWMCRREHHVRVFTAGEYQHIYSDHLNYKEEENLLTQEEVRQQLNNPGFNPDVKRQIQESIQEVCKDNTRKDQKFNYYVPLSQAISETWNKLFSKS